MRPVLRFFLIADSLFITVLGVGLTFMGVVIKFRTEIIDGYLTPLVKELPAGGGTGSDVWTLYNMNTIALMAFGVAVGISGFIGCLIAACPKQKAVVVFMVTLVVLMLAQLTSAALILTMKIGDNISATLKLNLVKTYSGDEGTDEFSAAWNYAFVSLSCCGVESYKDFKQTIFWDREKTYSNGTTYLVTVPVTCCKLPGKYPDFGNPYNESCPTDPSSENSYYEQNCYSKLTDYLQYYGILMSCPCIGVVFLEGVALAILVAVVMEMKRNRNKTKQSLMDDSFH